MKRAAAQVGAAAIVVSIAGYVAQFLAARWLGPADYTTFAVFWSVLFVVVGCLSGLGQEVIRVSRVAKLRADAGLVAIDEPTHPRIVPVVIALGAATSVVVAATGLLWGPPTFGAQWPTTIALLALAGVLVSGGLGAGGVAAGFARWNTYALLVSLEGVSRLVLFVGVALLLPTTLGFSIAAVLAFLPNLLVALLRGPLRREGLSIRSDAALPQSITRAARAMAASGLSGALVIGWPVILSAAAGANPRGSTAVSLGTLILLITLTRAPLMVPLTSFQNVLIARFTGFDLAGRRRWVALGAGAIVAASAVLAGLAALAGPPLLTLVFGAEYQSGPAIIAALTAATSGLGIITLTGVAAITAARHTLYLLGWGVAIAVSLLVVFLAPVPFEWATVLALLAGPVAGAIVQLGALRTPRAV